MLLAASVALAITAGGLQKGGDTYHDGRIAESIAVRSLGPSCAAGCIWNLGGVLRVDIWQEASVSGQGGPQNSTTGAPGAAAGDSGRAGGYGTPGVGDGQATGRDGEGPGAPGPIAFDTGRPCPTAAGPGTARGDSCFNVRASWYGVGDGFAGRTTASGETYGPYGLTAAAGPGCPWHLNETVRVCYRESCIEVRVNDTCGGCDEAMLDLSYGAFAALADPGVGVIYVEACGE